MMKIKNTISMTSFSTKRLQCELDDISKKIVDNDNKELIEILKRIEKQLVDIKYDLVDIKTWIK